MGKSLTLKYRPKTFEEIIGQNITTTILKKVVDTRTFKNCILLAGHSGCGKTTLARAFANAVNQGIGEPIEIDAASNNGVDNVRAIVESAKQRSLIGEYKIYIIDECHSITTQGWQAFLKGIEEPAPYTIFIFCTTEPNKIPATILNRVQRYNINPISKEDIYKRLVYICQQENFTNYESGCDLISKIAQGGMRDAITMLEQCADYSTDINVDNVKKVLGDFSYETMLRLTNIILDKKQAEMLQLLENLVNQGQDLKQFINSYLDFILDLTKYLLFKDINTTNIPAYLETVADNNINVKYTTGMGTGNENESLKYFNMMAEKLLNIKLNIKQDPSFKTTIEVGLIQLCRGE